MGLENFPNEILEKILQDRCLSYVDVSRFSRVCRRFREIGESEETWRGKFWQAWPRLPAQLPRARLPATNWRGESQKRVQHGRAVRQELSNFSQRFFSRAELSSADFPFFDDLLLQYNPDRSFIHLYILDELFECAGCDDLTLQYYAVKCLQHVQHAVLRPGYQSYAEDGEGPRLQYEAVLVMVARWSQPTKYISDHLISTRLDRLAQQVLEHLLTTTPDHPVFSSIRADQADTAEVELTRPPRLPAPLEEDCWSPPHCSQMLAAANHILYSVEGFAGNSDDYYNPNNSYIDVVLETKLGIPISLCLLYTSVLARLGVTCKPVNFPGHFLLKWAQHPEERLEADRFSYIDAYNGGKQLTARQARQLVHNLVTEETSFSVAKPLAVAQRMLRNLINIGASRSNNLRDSSYSLLRSSLELMLLLSTADTGTDTGFMLSRVYLQLDINHAEVIALLLEFRDIPGISDQVDYLMSTCQAQMAERNRPVEKIVKQRPEGVAYHTGQVCRHKRYNYVCVVTSWDEECQASRAWIQQMGVDRLQHRQHQPFYNVLVSDGSNRYAAQENLQPMQPEPVSHVEIGRYFCRFDPQRGYIANTELRQAFPGDSLPVLASSSTLSAVPL